ncbi:MAG: ATP-binding protein [Hyphomicrobium sp.]
MTDNALTQHLDLKVKPDLSSASQTLEEVSEFFRKNNVDTIFADNIVLILDELETNCINYGQKPGVQSSISLDIKLSLEEVEIYLRDNGIPFDPSEVDNPDLDTPIEERKIGGLGIHLVRSLSDFFSYERIGDLNEIKIIKKRKN